MNTGDPAQPVVHIPVNFAVEETADTIFKDGFDGP